MLRIRSLPLRCASRSGRPPRFLLRSCWTSRCSTACATDRGGRRRLVSDHRRSIVDTAIFFTIAFSPVSTGSAHLPQSRSCGRKMPVPFLNAGPLVPLWVRLAVADWGVKLSIALLALVPFRIIVGRMYCDDLNTT